MPYNENGLSQDLDKALSSIIPELSRQFNDKDNAKFKKILKQSKLPITTKRKIQKECNIFFKIMGEKIRSLTDTAAKDQDLTLFEKLALTITSYFLKITNNLGKQMPNFSQEIAKIVMLTLMSFVTTLPPFVILALTVTLVLVNVFQEKYKNYKNLKKDTKKIANNSLKAIKEKFLPDDLLRPLKSNDQPSKSSDSTINLSHSLDQSSLNVKFKNNPKLSQSMHEQRANSDKLEFDNPKLSQSMHKESINSKSSKMDDSDEFHSFSKQSKMCELVENYLSYPGINAENYMEENTILKIFDQLQADIKEIKQIGKMHQNDEYIEEINKPKAFNTEQFKKPREGIKLKRKATQLANKMKSGLDPDSIRNTQTGATRSTDKGSN